MISNIYYDTPEPWVMIGEAEWGACYEFDTLCVWQSRKTGEIRAAHDSGCSCPTPFEDYESMDATTKIESVHDLLAYTLTSRYVNETSLVVDPQWADLVAKVHRALREDTTQGAA